MISYGHYRLDHHQEFFRVNWTPVVRCTRYPLVVVCSKSGEFYVVTLITVPELNFEYNNDRRNKIIPKEVQAQLN